MTFWFVVFCTTPGHKKTIGQYSGLGLLLLPTGFALRDHSDEDGGTRWRSNLSLLSARQVIYLLYYLSNSDITIMRGSSNIFSLCSGHSQLAPIIHLYFIYFMSFTFRNGPTWMKIIWSSSIWNIQPNSTIALSSWKPSQVASRSS